jgi:release factor glutamine methyltransferase
MNVGEALQGAERTLRRHRCSAFSSRESEELLAWASRSTREQLLAHPERRLSAAAERKFRGAIRRRAAHAPVEYITGRASFFGRRFMVTRETLIPRPATEVLVEAVLDAARPLSYSPTLPLLVDIGTGSGCIAATLALELPGGRIIATDTSSGALRIARANARRHGVSDRIRFIKADLLPTLPLSHSPTRPLIIANLPYVPTARLRALPPDVRLHEPRQALDGGKDGLDYYRRLLQRISALRPVPCALFFEILPEQFEPLAAEAQRSLPGCRTRKISNLEDVAVGLHIAS